MIRCRESRPGAAPPRPSVPGTIGVLGGTFDPIHVGHLAVAEEAREALGLERILFVPAGQPPHKPGRPISPPEHRVAMVEIAIADNPAFECSRLEVDRAGPSFTVDTVSILLAEARPPPRPAVTVIVSAESFADFAQWHEPARLLGLARLAVVPREGYSSMGRSFVTEHFPGHEDRVTFLDEPRLAVSATDIRARVAAGRSIRYLVPQAVAVYIGDHALYSEPLPRKQRWTGNSDGLEDPAPVTDPSPVVPRADGLPRRVRRAAPARRAAPERSPLDLARRIVELAEDKKAADIVLLDLSALTTLADHFVICSGGSERQLDAIADAVIGGLRAEGVRPIGREGVAASHWVLLDYGSVVVHVFTPPERDYYQLEKHWAEARTVLRVQ